MACDEVLDNMEDVSLEDSHVGDDKLKGKFTDHQGPE